MSSQQHGPLLKARVPSAVSYTFDFSFSICPFSSANTPVQDSCPHPTCVKVNPFGVDLPECQFTSLSLSFRFRTNFLETVMSLLCSRPQLQPLLNSGWLDFCHYLLADTAPTVDSNGFLRVGTQLQASARLCRTRPCRPPRHSETNHLCPCPRVRPSCLSFLPRCLYHWLLFLHSPFTTCLSEVSSPSSSSSSSACVV